MFQYTTKCIMKNKIVLPLAVVFKTVELPVLTNEYLVE
jgi:hypothetical protein